MGPLAFLIGADAFSEIQTWHRWREVVSLVEFIVVTRPGATYARPGPDAARVEELSGLYLPISSSDIRARLARGERRIPVPDAVLAYIEERCLYTGSETRSQLS